jgi:galactonate dehydratase
VVEVARKVNVPIATGESFSSIHQHAELLSHNAVHILQPEPGSMGGIWRTRQLCAMADAFYGVVAPHNAQGPISTATCIQISASCPNLLTQELFDEFNVSWEHDLVTNPATVIDGRLQIPDGPGLGTDLNWSELDKHPYQASNFLPLFAVGWERREGETSPVAPS